MRIHLLVFILLVALLTGCVGPGGEVDVNQPLAAPTTEPASGITSQLSPARDLTGTWKSPFRSTVVQRVQGWEPGIYGVCEYSFEFTVGILQSIDTDNQGIRSLGNRYYGYLDAPGTGALIKQVAPDDTPPICSVGAAHIGLTIFGNISSSSIIVVDDFTGKVIAEGAFTTDLMTLNLKSCIVNIMADCELEASTMPIKLTRADSEIPLWGYPASAAEEYSRWKGR